MFSGDSWGLYPINTHYIYGAASPTPPPPLWMGHGPPPPLWLWGCGGALLVSDAADFLWFLVPVYEYVCIWICIIPPPPCGVGNGGVVVVVVVVVVEVVVVVVIW